MTEAIASAKASATRVGPACDFWRGEEGSEVGFRRHWGRSSSWRRQELLPGEGPSSSSSTMPARVGCCVASRGCRTREAVTMLRLSQDSRRQTCG
jgi:hypothetical protein